VSLDFLDGASLEFLDSASLLVVTRAFALKAALVFAWLTLAALIFADYNLATFTFAWLNLAALIFAWLALAAFTFAGSLHAEGTTSHAAFAWDIDGTTAWGIAGRENQASIVVAIAVPGLDPRLAKGTIAFVGDSHCLQKVGTVNGSQMATVLTASLLSTLL